MVSSAEDGDEVANKILHDSVQELADTVIAVVRRLRLCGEGNAYVDHALGLILFLWWYDIKSSHAYKWMPYICLINEAKTELVFSLEKGSFIPFWPSAHQLLCCK